MSTSGGPTAYYWTSMSISGGLTAYYCTSMPPRTWDPGNTGNNPFYEPAILAATQSNQSTGQLYWLSSNQTSKLDSHPGCHSIKPVNSTAILAATQSNQPVNPRGRQADLKGGSGGAAAPQEGSDDGGGFPTTLDIWRSPGPTCPGTKYAVRRIPHCDKQQSQILTRSAGITLSSATILHSRVKIWLAQRKSCASKQARH